MALPMGPTTIPRAVQVAAIVTALERLLSLGNRRPVITLGESALETLIHHPTVTRVQTDAALVRHLGRTNRNTDTVRTRNILGGGRKVAVK